MQYLLLLEIKTHVQRFILFVCLSNSKNWNMTKYIITILLITQSLVILKTDLSVYTRWEIILQLRLAIILLPVVVENPSIIY